MKVKIVFFAWNTFYGKLIRFGTKCKYTHVGIIGDENDKEYTIYEALNKGLIRSNYNKQHIEDLINESKVKIKEIEIQFSDSNQIKKHCDNYLGNPYDWLSIFNIITYTLFRRYALNIKGSRLLICSEFVARVLYDLGLNLSKILNKDYDYITPADIYNYLEDGKY